MHPPHYRLLALLSLSEADWRHASPQEEQEWRDDVESKLDGPHRRGIIALQLLEKKLDAGLLCHRNLFELAHHRPIDFTRLPGVGVTKARAIDAYLASYLEPIENVQENSVDSNKALEAFERRFVFPLRAARVISESEDFKARAEGTTEAFFDRNTPDNPSRLRKPMLALRKISQALINPISSHSQVELLIESGVLQDLSAADVGVKGLGVAYAESLAKAIADETLVCHLARGGVPLAERLMRAHESECEARLSRVEFDLPLALAGDRVGKDAHEIFNRLEEALLVDFRRPRVLEELRNAEKWELENLPSYGSEKALRLFEILRSPSWKEDLSASRYLVKTPRELDQLLVQMIEESMEVGGSSSEIFCRRIGYLVPQETLQEVGDSLGVSRERVRQLEVMMVERISRRVVPADGVSLKDDIFLDFNNYPLLSLALQGSVDCQVGQRGKPGKNRVARLLRYLGLWNRNTGAETERYGELVEIPSDQLVPLVFSDLEAPVYESDLITSLRSLSGCSHLQAIRFVQDQLVAEERVIVFEGRFFPGRMVPLASFIAKSMENGGHWKEIVKIVFTVTGRLADLNRTVNRATIGWIGDNPDLYLCGKGRYRHVRYLDGNYDQLEAFLLRVREGMTRDKVVRMHLDQAMESYSSKEACDRWAFRWFVRAYGADYGLVLDGQSRVDDLVLDQGDGVARDGSRGVAARLVEVLSKSSRPLVREDLFEQAKVHKPTGELQCSILLQSGKIVALGKRRYCSVELSADNWEHREVVENIEKARAARCKEVTAAELRDSLAPPNGLERPSPTWVRSIMRVYAVQNQLDIRQGVLNLE